MTGIVQPLDTADTRTRLVHTAVDAFWRRSYVATGVDELCRRAGARKGSFYHFFPTKADLAVAAIAFHWNTVRQGVFEPIASTGRPGLDRLDRLVERTGALQRQALTGGGALPGCPFGNLGQEMAHQDSRIRAAVQTVFDGHCEYLRQWIDEAARMRQIPQGDNPRRARQAFALFEGALLLAKVAADPSVFAEVCLALPDILGRGSAGPRPSAGTAPELL